MYLWRAVTADLLFHPPRVEFVLPPIIGFATAVSQIALLKKHGLRLRKGLGQHILTDDNVAGKITSALGLRGDEGVIEIGPGLGALTMRLREQASQVVAVEIDRRFASTLRAELEGAGTAGNVEIIEDNILKVDLAELTGAYPEIKTWKVVGNLPYYITSAILLMLVEARCHFTSAIITVQDEFARRLVAGPGSKDYSSLSIYVQYRFKPEILFTIKPTSFFPRPDVRSAVVRLQVLERSGLRIEDEGLFFQTIRAAFGQRRKTLRRSLRMIPGLTPDTIGELDRTSGVGLDKRPEDISIDDFANLSNAIKDVVG
ncbi:MAG TPA: 16S rRNA (adenine(1518)-N(6)/adenine(1519)-N(6))-dimethyltransferase RsmA [bacterium]|nr:16S rRNA (adenine(1518)-N(6)/adenine(1519)-N(6))-dimethyltransferase RsmA [bacterium]